MADLVFPSESILWLSRVMRQDVPAVLSDKSVRRYSLNQIDFLRFDLNRQQFMFCQLLKIKLCIKK